MKINRFTYKLLKIIGVSLLIFTSSNLLSQNMDEQMAKYYYQKEEYSKAKLYYEKIVKINFEKPIFEEYLNTLVELKEFNIAEKEIKKRIKWENKGAYYKIKLGELYEQEGEKEKANKYYKSLTKKMGKKNSRQHYERLTKEFVRIQKFDLAIEILEKCNSFHPSPGYLFSIANLYGKRGDYEKMIDSYLDLIQDNPYNLARVKNFLPKTINFTEDEKNTELLRKKLLKKVQKNPENNTLYDFLIWFFLQKRDFQSAYTQVKALDKRTKADGEKLYNFAGLCISNKEYDIAIVALEEVIKNGDEIDYYVIAAKQKVLVALQNKIFSSANYTRSDLYSLESKYLTTLQGLKSLDEKSNVIEGLAYLEGFYIHNIDTAEFLYKQILSMPGLSQKKLALNKIKLADIYMLKNEIWDASLLYLQVEKKFKHDIVGSTAKFKNAKLYYYSGDFEWAQNQLDGLKASTSKLISNDAIDLSLLITDNYNMDTTTANMKQFSQADLLIFQNKFDEAIMKLDSINERSPAHSLSDEILYKRYEIAFKKQNFESARVFLNKIITNYPEDILADNALFKLAELEENQFKKTKEAFKLYEKLLFEYPGSLYAVEARKRYRKYVSTLSKAEQFERGIKIDKVE